MNLDELLDTQTRVSYIVRIATASRTELEQWSMRIGLEHRQMPITDLRSALRQRVIAAPVEPTHEAQSAYSEPMHPPAPPR
ncbi:MAG: hypothetical protein R3E83_24045 [Burkholderiaceae bacterium]